MKKFSKLITESKSDEFRQHPLMNPVDWEEIFLPLINHIENNYDVPSPGDSIFTKETVNSLISFIEKVNNDYKNYYQYVVDDGSQESFLSSFNIDCDWSDIIDITTPLSDNCDDVDEEASWDEGIIYTYFTKFRYTDIDEVISDIEEVCEKLKMIDVDYSITIKLHLYLNENQLSGRAQTHKKYTIKSNTNWLEDAISGLKNDFPDRIKKIDKIKLAIYNEETLTTSDNTYVPNHLK